MIFGTRWFGFSLAVAMVALTIYGVYETRIGILPPQYAATRVSDTATVDTSAVDDIPELREAFDEGIEESLRELPARKAAGLRLAFGSEWQDIVRRTTRERGWPVVKRHAAQVLREMAFCGLDPKSEAGGRYFAEAMQRRRPAINSELEQAIGEADLAS